MNAQDYIWLVVEKRKAKSARKTCCKSRSKSKSKCKDKGKQNKNYQIQDQSQRIKQLELQNRMLRKENAILNQYFTMRKSSQKQGQPVAPIRQSMMERERGDRYWQVEEKDKGEATTMHSEGKAEKRLLNFGSRKK